MLNFGKGPRFPDMARDMEYVPYFALGDRPHVIADGSSRRSTVLTLSHWPRSGTPWPLKADLSTEIAFRYLDDPSFAVGDGAAVVSNDHLDVDGFVTVAVLADAAFAQRHRDLLVEVARAGDFATTRDATARRVAFTLGALTDPQRSTLPPAVFEGSRPEQVARLYPALLAELPRIVDDVDAYHPLWADEEESFVRSEAAIDEGAVVISEHPDADLAVVDLDPTLHLEGDHRFCLQGWGPVHPLAVHNRTDALRVLYVAGPRYGLVYRFESWVQLVSRRAAPRVDLTDLALELSAAETGGTRWSWGFPRNPNPPTPWLRADDNAPSTLARADLLERLRRHLTTAAPTVDPYDARPYGAGADLTRAT